MISCPRCHASIAIVPKSLGEIRDASRQAAKLAAQAVFAAEHRAMRTERHDRLRAIAAAVAEFYYLTLDAMLEPGSKQYDLVRPRQVAIYLMSQAASDISQREISAIVGRDRSTVSSSVSTVRARMKADPEFRDGVERVAALLGIAA